MLQQEWRGDDGDDGAGDDDDDLNEAQLDDCDDGDDFPPLGGNFPGRFLPIEELFLSLSFLPRRCGEIFLLWLLQS
jgi:hypothetical protein